MPIFDKNKSKIKLWVGTGGSKANVHYSILTHDNKPDEVIINKMIKRILVKYYKNNFGIAVFYDNKSGNEIKRIKGTVTITNNTINKKTAKIKLWIGLPADMKNETWYNFESVNESEDTEIIRLMTEKILRDKYQYQFTKAMFFNNQTGTEIKTIEGILKKSNKNTP